MLNQGISGKGMSTKITIKPIIPVLKRQGPISENSVFQSR